MDGDFCLESMSIGRLRELSALLAAAIAAHEAASDAGSCVDCAVIDDDDVLTLVVTLRERV